VSDRRTERRRGTLVARLLAGGWRAVPPPLEMGAADLREIAGLLLRSGGAGLAWRRLRELPLAASPEADRLRQAYRLQVLRASLHERDLQHALAILRAIGIEPLLVKGWAVARWYPEPPVRAYGDIDLCVRPGDFGAVKAALGEECTVDLHCGLPPLDDRPLQDIWQRAVAVAGEGFSVATPAREDHLRYLCLHALAHGICRPLWLADLGAAVETAEALDWDRVLSGDGRRTQWVICALGLASRLLGARLMGAPVRVAEAPLPKWLIPSVLEGWGRPTVAHGNRTPMAHYLRRPAGLMGALRSRWPGPIEASIGRRAAFDERPRLPIQAAECVSRTLRFARAVPALLRAADR
jgi:hypothetical protein